MPTYEYVCKACGNAWEASQRIVEAPLTECPKCHRPEAQRQISAGNFILKGGGWYADLYSSSPKKPAAAASSDSATSSTETKSDTKSETKTETKSSDASSTAAAPAPSGDKK